MAVTSTEAYDFTLEVAEIDGDLLMELLEEPGAEPAEDGALGCIIRSLEAEIACNAQPDDDLYTDDSQRCCSSLYSMLSDLDNHEYCSGSPASDMMTSDCFPLDWAEMENGMIDGWYMDEGEVNMEYGDQRDVYGGFSYGANKSSFEQLYIPLWH